MEIFELIFQKKFEKKTCRPLVWPLFQRLSQVYPPSSFFAGVWTYNSKSTHSMKKCRTANQSWQFLRLIAVYYVFVAILLLELSLISYKTCWKLWPKALLYLARVYKKCSHIFMKHISNLLKHNLYLKSITLKLLKCYLGQINQMKVLWV